MPVSTATSFRVKMYLRSTMKTERLSALALIHAYRDMLVDVEAVILHQRMTNFLVSLSSKISDMFATNVLLVRVLTVCLFFLKRFTHAAQFCF